MCLTTQGGDVQPVYTTDGEMLFRQEAYFHYLFGVNEDGFWGALDVRNVSCNGYGVCLCLPLLLLLLLLVVWTASGGRWTYET
jgi:hypothetical protein